jgi:arylformamidase
MTEADVPTPRTDRAVGAGLAGDHILRNRSVLGIGLGSLLSGGHSAGADIVANVAVNPTYLKQHRLDLSAIRCAGPLDTKGFDKAAAEPGGEKSQWSAALGNDPTYVADTSATLHITGGQDIPSTIGVYRGTARRQQIETAYLDKLKAAGVATTLIDARTLTHNQVNSRIGAAGDSVITPPLVAFLTNCFAK